MRRGPVEDGVRAVGIDVNLDPGSNEVRAHRGFRDLELKRPVGDAIVVSDLPLLLDAQDLVEIDAGNGREGGVFAWGSTAKRASIGGDEDVADEGGGVLDRRDPGESELLDQAILKRPEGALRTTSRLR